MGYQNKALSGGRLVVAKNTDPLVVSEVLEAERKLTQEIGPAHGERKRLADMRGVKIDHISFGKLSEIADKLSDSRQGEKGVQIAVVTGPRDREDHVKFSSYTKYEVNSDSSIRAFETLEEAMDWLQLSDEERREVVEFLA